MTDSPLPPALDAERLETRGRSGRICYYAAGKGRPMLLIHSINAAASAYEVRPVFEHGRKNHRVYAPDLPGYGLSDRSERPYTVALFCDAVRDMLDVLDKRHPGEPVDVLGLSLSAEFVARVASEQPARFRSLTLVTPTGFRAGSQNMRKAPGTTREVPGLYKALTVPLWRGPLYRVLVTRRSIRYFLERTFGSDQVDDGLVDYAYLTTHQPGATHAPYAFLSGRLFSADIRDVYERLTLPVWLAHGTRGDFKDFREAEWARQRPNWTVQAFETGALVYYEKPAEFFRGFDRFMG